MLIRMTRSVAGVHRGVVFSYRQNMEVDVSDDLGDRLVEGGKAVYMEDPAGEPIVMLKRRGRPPKNVGPTEFKSDSKDAPEKSPEPKTVGPAKAKDK